MREAVYIHCRVLPTDATRLVRYASSMGLTESELLRQLISLGLKERGQPTLAPIKRPGRPRKDSR